MKISELVELTAKSTPLTCGPDTSVQEAVTLMAEKNFGSIMITDADNRVIGVMTERDIFRRLIGEERDPKTTRVREIMTSEVRLARESDNVIDWLQVMSNERFRRLPIVDDEQRLKAVLSQGDFVAYTWPQIISQFSLMTKATLAPAFNPIAIALGVAGYGLVILLIVLAFVGAN